MMRRLPAAQVPLSLVSTGTVTVEPSVLPRLESFAAAGT